MQARPLPVRGAPPEPVHMALLMMVPGDRQTGPHVRLVQDFGSSDEPAGLPEAPPLRAAAVRRAAGTGRAQARPPGRQPHEGAGPTAATPARGRSDPEPSRAQSTKQNEFATRCSWRKNLPSAAVPTSSLRNSPIFFSDLQQASRRHRCAIRRHS
jgi:hypothetical protein